MLEPINQFFYSALSWINSWVGNWGWAMVVFTIMIRLVLTPLDYKSRVSMRKTTKLQPQLQALQKKYANDKDKLNAKTAELYKKAHVNPLSSCLPLLLTWPILICVFTAMRMAANAEMLKQVGQMLNGQESFEGWLWIKNLWMPDNVFSSAYPDARTLSMISAKEWATWFEGLKEMPALMQNTDFSALSADALSGVPETLIESIKANGWTPECFNEANFKGASQIIYSLLNHARNADGELFYQLGNATTGLSVPLLGDIHNSMNGYIILPIMSMVSQIVMTKIMSKGQPQQTNANGQPTGKLMQYFFPVFSLVLCFNYSSAFALYWVAGNLVSMGQTLVINKYLDAKEKKAEIAGEGSVK